MARKSTGSGLWTRIISVIPEDLRERAWRLMVRLGITLAVVTILCSMAVIVKKHVARSPHYQVDARTLVPDRLPSWAGPQVRRDLARLTRIPAHFSILESGVCERVAEAFKRNPWVAEVRSVRKVFPNHVYVSLRLRRPVAGVFCNHRFYLVDASARRLTGAMSRWPEGANAPPLVISNTHRLPPRGEIWPDDDVRGAAAVARQLLAWRDRLQTRFVAIDLTNVKRCSDWYKGDMHLVTDDGAFVKWGRSPLRVIPGELTPEEKIDKMVQFERKRGPISDYSYVDIRYDDVQHGPRLRTFRAER